MSITISRLMLFPVKSLGGVPLLSATLTATGLEYDRHWMIINEHNKFVTQRQAQYKAFALIDTQLTATHLILSRSGMKNCYVNLAPPSSTAFDAVVWKDSVVVVDEGDEVSKWLMKATNCSGTLRLVRIAPGHKRPQSKPELLGEDTYTDFADSAPLLVVNTAWLDALNKQSQSLGLPLVDMLHFRPNIVIEGLAAYGEHHIEQLYHENYQLSLCYPCQRCVVITIDPDTGERYAGQHPFQQLARQNSMPSQPKAPAFGENAIISSGINQIITVGDCLMAVTKN